MQLQQIDDPGREWDAFVERTPGAALGHAAAWAAILRESDRITPHYLAARDASGALAGVLPLVCFRTLRGRRELVSLPFLDTGGVLAIDGAAERCLLDGAHALARDLGADALELRQLAPLREGPAAPAQDRIDLVLPLTGDEEAQWKALGAKVRNQTRKAMQSGLSAATVGSAHARVADFFAPFAINMRDLGSPPHARRFYEVAADVFGERLSIHLALLNDRSVGGLVAIDYAGAVTVPWASTLREERARCPNNLIYWDAIRWAIARGAREFDFGRSPRDSGTHRFKLGWGARERDLAWIRFGRDGQRESTASHGPGAWMQRLSAVWMRLPVPVATAVGARVRPDIAN